MPRPQSPTRRNLPREAQSAGVYQIRNVRTGHVYIGSTTHPIADRWRRHVRDLWAGTHACQALQRAHDRDGLAAFVVEVLTAIAPGAMERSALRELEQAAIDRVAIRSTLYNRNRASAEQPPPEDALAALLDRIAPDPL